MTDPRRSRWLSLGLPIAFALCAAAAVAILMLLPGAQPQAQAAEIVPEAKAGFQTTERLVLSVNLPAGERKKDGTLLVELIDGKGKVLASEEREVPAGKDATSHRFEFKSPGVVPEQITVRCTFGKTPAEVPLKKILLTKAHETALTTGQEFFVGSQASLRCEVHGVKSLSQNIPLPGASIKVQLQGKGGKPIDLFEGKADKDGVADVQLKVPPTVAAGAYKMVVTTKSVLGEEKLERDVKVKTGPRILLVTDKPLYQPGQQIHVRALALQAFSLQPVAGSPLVFEIEDAKGNKVFKRSTKTTKHGIAHVDFQLADEVNQGDYHIRALLGEHTADKTVSVKPYVLPKFKTNLKADKKYYLPKETIHADVQVDYFFGKPVARGKIKVTASTFDVAFKDFQTWEGKTDANGHAKFEIKLPASFVGQPLQKGNALVKLEAKVTDTADHTETITRTYPVSDQAIRVSLIPEGGRLVPGLENRIFAAALYPDGSPAKCDVQLWTGQNTQGKPFATVKTNDAGLAEFTLTPKAEQFRQGQWGQRNVEMLGGTKQIGWAPQPLFDLTAVARDDQGNTAEAKTALTSEPLGENVLLRLDKAIYKGGERLGLDVRTSAGLPTVYLDVVRSGQTLLTKWLDVKAGRARYALDLPASVFGTLEVHAYQMLGSGEIIRDSRVIYVNPANDLHIDVKADKDVYLPGGKGTIRFAVTDSNGKPAAAALGVLVVDEAVYALQEMQPGLEKVYFTLQEELLKPQVQIGYKPNERIDNLVREPALAASQQQVAQALLTAIKPKPPAHWNVNPVLERRQKIEAQVMQIGWALQNYIQSNKPVLAYNETAKEWGFRPKLLQVMVKANSLQANQLIGPFGDQIKLEDLTRMEKGFRPERIGRMLTHHRMVQLFWPVINYTNTHRANYFKNGEWDLPETVLKDAAKQQRLGEEWLKDAWGHPIRIVKLKKKVTPMFGHQQFAQHEMVSVGPDGKLGTADDVKLTLKNWNQAQAWWIEDDSRQLVQAQQQLFHRGRGLEQLRLQNEGAVRFKGAPGGFGGGGFPMRGAGGLPVPAANIPRAPGAAPMLAEAKIAAGQKAKTDAGPVSQAAPITRMREYFPETLLWNPALITDEQGHATLPIDFADSITTWRLTASASSRGGSLGGTTTPLRVFQDFFVDLDLPIALTQNDEVAFPVAVYNYLKEPQTVKLDLQQEPWFDLVDDQGFSRSLELKPNEVTSVKFRIRARRIGNFPLTVKAHGAKMSDAIKRGIEVVPDGKKVEQVVSDRLKGTVKQTITLPETAIADTGKLFVKVYPGVFSQILEGADGILRMPGGCFEQTSSSAYPNILVADYIKKNHLESPALLMKAENYLNVGYQRLLTFERPGGGFDWWGSGEPLIWLSAYGLQEFNDMSKVYPVDRGVIERTQRWLLKQQAPDGTWSKIGATHSVSIERMGDPKLLLTSYVTWSLLDSGLRVPELKKSIAYIRDHVKTADNAYILALAANALASWDAKDDSTHEALTKVLKKLEEKKQEKPEWKACCFPAKGQSLTYARDDGLTVETTAMAVLAMLKNGQFTNSVNQALTYLVKSKGPYGCWGSTQATILSLKALVAASGGIKQKGEAEFVIRVNGKEAATGKVTEANADVLQQFDLKEHVRPGANEVTLEVKGDTSLMYQVVGRHFEPWAKEPPKEELLKVAVEYDRTKLSTKDLLKAKATLRYNGKVPTAMMMVVLGIPPGFTVDAGDFSEMVGAKKIQRFSLTARQVTLYLGDVEPGSVQSFEYTLKPKYPIRAKTPSTVAYEYYTPANRAASKPVDLVVEEKK